MPYFNCPKVEIYTLLWKLLGLSDGRRARLGKGGASGKEQLASGCGSSLSGSSAPSSAAAESGVGMTRCSRDSGAKLQKRAQSLQLPAESRGRGFGVQSSACFCNCFDDALACSHHYRDTALSS